MPELPEVESLRQLLAASVVGRRISGVAITQPQLRRRLAADLPQRVSGATIKAVSRRAKYLLMDLGELTLVVHLGMSGSLTHRGGDFESEFNHIHDHVRMALDDGSALVYNDPRRFGLLLAVPSSRLEQIEELRGLGPEPLGTEFNAGYLARVARGRQTSIKALLLDQRVVAGIGNIYAAEILFAAGIRPQRRAGRLSRAELARLAAVTPAILRAAIGKGGTTFRNYRDSRGQPGRFAPLLKVYGRAGERCYICGTTVLNRIVGQRASAYCPRCQR
ncbi:MAG TPA: bifunctional DNA-formamidopyrimidine glycosylase/DNA-(apurinic or apyrimidinic site) lyase [Candidatus Binataceae bacterium]|nr:bifunctional DNA-formamidopyrimidine glycosylase/DNA-(apurinic or apyrimidinic site) lyase [Candidatus Binataceae bacterium]